MSHVAEDHPQEDRPRGPASQGRGKAQAQKESQSKGVGQWSRQKAMQVRHHVMIEMVGVSLLGPWGT